MGRLPAAPGGGSPPRHQIRLSFGLIDPIPEPSLHPPLYFEFAFLLNRCLVNDNRKLQPIRLSFLLALPIAGRPPQELRVRDGLIDHPGFDVKTHKDSESVLELT